MRDVVASRAPLLLTEDIYATAGLLGAGEPIAFAGGLAAAFALRVAALGFNWSRPKLRGQARAFAGRFVPLYIPRHDGA